MAGVGVWGLGILCVGFRWVWCLGCRTKRLGLPNKSEQIGLHYTDSRKSPLLIWLHMNGIIHTRSLTESV